MEQSNTDGSPGMLADCSPLTLEVLPMELLVYLFSFLTSTRDRVKLRYVSQRLRLAVETPSLWRDFTWPFYDRLEECSIESVLKLCGKHVRQLSFPNNAICVKLLKQCGNVLQLSLPSVKLSVDQLRTIMQSMPKLQNLDVLWVSKTDVKVLLLLVGYPVYGHTVKELTIREKVNDSSCREALVFLLNEWTASMLVPQVLNVVSDHPEHFHPALQKWWILFKDSKPQPGHHSGYLSFYTGCHVVIGLAAIFPWLRIEINFLPSFTFSFVTPEKFGLPASGHGIMLTERNSGHGSVIHKGVLMERDCDFRTPIMNITNINFLTHFCAKKYGLLCSEHLEHLAAACPNLQELNLQDNTNCLKNLRGLRSFVTHRKLEGLNIANISIEDLESCVELWEILVDMQLSYLAIEFCCLLCSGHQTNQIVSLHQKCTKLLSLETFPHCESCWVTNHQPLLLSNFPLLVHCDAFHIENVIICDRLKYLFYLGERHTWEMANCNLEQVCIVSNTLSLSDDFMITISAHGGLTHVILSAKFVTETGIATLIENSPNLQTCCVYRACVSRDFRLELKEKYASRKLFLCGKWCFLKRRIKFFEVGQLTHRQEMNSISLWYCT